MKSLVIYFSRTDENYFGGSIRNIDKGNTEVIAEYIKKYTDADLFKVEPLKQYSTNYKECCDEALSEQNNNERPELKRYLEDISEYDTIYIGSPIYWGTMPQSVFTQLEKLDFSNKNIYVFTTHEGSGLGRVPEDVKKVCKCGNLIDSIAISGSKVYESEEKIKEWIQH